MTPCTAMSPWTKKNGCFPQRRADLRVTGQGRIPERGDQFQPRARSRCSARRRPASAAIVSAQLAQIFARRALRAVEIDLLEQGVHQQAHLAARELSASSRSVSQSRPRCHRHHRRRRPPSAGKEARPRTRSR